MVSAALAVAGITTNELAFVAGAGHTVSVAVTSATIEALRLATALDTDVVVDTGRILKTLCLASVAGVVTGVCATLSRIGHVQDTGRVGATVDVGCIATGSKGIAGGRFAISCALTTGAVVGVTTNAFAYIAGAGHTVAITVTAFTVKCFALAISADANGCAQAICIILATLVAVLAVGCTFKWGTRSWLTVVSATKIGSTGPGIALALVDNMRIRVAGLTAVSM